MALPLFPVAGGGADPLLVDGIAGDHAHRPGGLKEAELVERLPHPPRELVRQDGGLGQELGLLRGGKACRDVIQKLQDG